MSIPSDLEDALRSMREAGLQPEFSEPAQPVLQDGSCLLPLSFQVRHFGRPLEPGMLDNDPNRQVLVAGAMSGQVDDLPEAARNVLNWTLVEQDPKTQAVTSHWEEPDDGG